MTTTALDTVTSGLASMARMPLAAGQSTTVASSVRPQASTLVFYDRGESDVESRSIREVLTYLDLSVLTYPCAAGSRHSLRQRTLPALIDGSVTLTGSEEIIKYCFDKYGGESFDVNPLVNAASHAAASALRGLRGSSVDLNLAPFAAPRKPLEFYGYEGNQFCRLVRETMYELDLPFLNIATGKGSTKRRQDLFELSGATQCPYLVDPNTGTQLGDSQAIIKYLRDTYSRASSPKKSSGDRGRRRRHALKAAIADFGAKTRRGAAGFASADDRIYFDGLLAELVSLNPTRNPATSPLLNAPWDLVWTTEKELLFVADKGIFGIPCTAVTQTIDVPGNKLQNLIFCCEDGSSETAFLRVDSSIAVVPDSKDRLEFEFNACSFKWKGLQIPLPPVGKGGLEVAYLDDDFRVQFDTRGDTLIATRRPDPSPLLAA